LSVYVDDVSSDSPVLSELLCEELTVDVDQLQQTLSMLRSQRTELRQQIDRCFWLKRCQRFICFDLINFTRRVVTHFRCGDKYDMCFSESRSVRILTWNPVINAAASATQFIESVTHVIAVSNKVRSAGGKQTDRCGI